MAAYREPSPGDQKPLKSFCSEEEIAAITRVLNNDYGDVLLASDATLLIVTHPKHALLRDHLAKIHQRLKFEVGIIRVVNVEQPEENLEKKYRIRLISGPRTNRSYLRYYTLMAAVIIESHLRKNK